MNALVTLDKINPLKVFTDNGLDPVLKDIQDLVDAFEPDLSTVTSRKAIASMAAKVASSKTFLDDLGKQLNKDKRTEIDAVDAERKRMRDYLDVLKKDVRQPLTDFENDELSRVEALEQRLLNIKTLDKLYEIGASVEEIQAAVNAAEAVVIDATWQEFEEQAGEIKAGVLMSLLGKLEAAVTAAEQAAQFIKQQEELEAARLENERLEQEKRDREAADKAEQDRVEAERESAAREERLKTEAAESARAEAEEGSRKEIARLEQEKKDAEEREIRAKIATETAAQVERDRIAAEAEAEKVAAQTREKDKQHRGKINNAAKAALITIGLQDKDAEAVVVAVAKGQVPNIAISY